MIKDMFASHDLIITDNEQDTHVILHARLRANSADCEDNAVIKISAYLNVSTSMCFIKATIQPKWSTSNSDWSYGKCLVSIGHDILRCKEILNIKQELLSKTK